MIICRIEVFSTITLNKNILLNLFFLTWHTMFLHTRLYVRSIPLFCVDLRGTWAAPVRNCVLDSTSRFVDYVSIVEEICSGEMFLVSLRKHDAEACLWEGIYEIQGRAHPWESCMFVKRKVLEIVAGLYFFAKAATFYGWLVTRFHGGLQSLTHEVSGILFENRFITDGIRRLILCKPKYRSIYNLLHEH